MIAGCTELFGQIFEDWCISLYLYLRGLAVHHMLRLYHIRSKRLRDTLMSQTNTKNRRGIGKRLDDIQCYPCLIRCGGARREDDLLRVKCLDLLYGHLIVSDHLQICSQFSTVLYDIVGEAVVVVYH